MKFHLMALALLTLAAGRAEAQTMDPNVIRFLPSAEHNSINADGTPVVSRYDLEIFQMGATQPSLVVELGKPVPAADGYVYATWSMPTPDASLETGPLEVQVAAIGAGGVARSGRSNLFELSGCRLAVAGSLYINRAGGQLSIPITTSDICVWSATSASAWITTTAWGTSNGQIDMTVSPNPTSVARLGAIRVGPQLVLVFQAGP